MQKARRTHCFQRRGDSAWGKRASILLSNRPPAGQELLGGCILICFAIPRRRSASDKVGSRAKCGHFSGGTGSARCPHITRIWLEATSIERSWSRPDGPPPNKAAPRL